MFWWVLGGFFAVLLILLLIFAFQAVVTVFKFIIFAIISIFELIWVGIASLAGRGAHRRAQRDEIEAAQYETAVVPPYEAQGARTFEDGEVRYTPAPPPRGY